jgi:hypothetical protein
VELEYSDPANPFSWKVGKVFPEGLLEIQDSRRIIMRIVGLGPSGSIESQEPEDQE